MAKMSQKELLEEGFSDKIRGIAKAAGAGLKLAAAQGTRLDTGTLAMNMGGAYKGEQPIAVLKDTLAKSKDIDIVKINKAGIKKQQAGAKKGYIGRIVGPKSITLIPFEGVLLGKPKQPDARQYEGPSAGPSIAEATAYMDDSRDEKGGAYAPVNKPGSVVEQIFNFMVKSGVSEEGAKTFTAWAERNMKFLLKYVTETHPNIKFTYKGKPELGVTDFPDEEKVDVTESLSLKDIIQLSSKVLIVEANEKRDELRRRAAKLGIEGRTRMKIGELEAAIAEAEKRKVAADETDEIEKRFKERNPEVAEPEPEPVAEPEAKAEAPRNEVAAVGYKKFIEGLDDEVIKELLKTLQVAQPGYRIKFEGEQKEEEAPGEKEPGESFQGEEGMFVAEIFRTKKGLKVGDIYRQEDPTDVVWSGESGSGKGKVKGEEEKGKVSPVDVAVAKLVETGIKQPSLDQLIAKIKELVGMKEISQDAIKINELDAKRIGVEARLKPEAIAKLQDKDIELVKQTMKKLRIIKEGTSQKNLLRQLTLLSR